MRYFPFDRFKPRYSPLDGGLGQGKPQSGAATPLFSLRGTLILVLLMSFSFIFGRLLHRGDKGNAIACKNCPLVTCLNDLLTEPGSRNHVRSLPV